MSPKVSLGGCDPILCAPLLRQVDDHLLTLLRSLNPAEWDLPTVAPLWKVRDVAAHLLDTSLRKVSLVRDSCSVESAGIGSHQDVVDLVNRLNREGVTVYRRLSTPLLIEMIALACAHSADFHESLDPFAPAAFNVSWAGEDTSLNWFDTARELTERWHHQQQIRLATSRPGIMTPGLYYPVLDCFMRGLPHTYRNTHAPVGSAILFEISGDCGGQWILSRSSSAWNFLPQPPSAFAAIALIPQQIAWRLFTRGINPESARAQIEIHGDRNLAEGILNLTAIVA